MSKSILITGGEASGKTRFAVTHFEAFDYVLYLRMGEPIDPDVRHRIEFSTDQNGVEWDIVNSQSISPADEVSDHKFVIFDSIPSFTRQVMQIMLPEKCEIDEVRKKDITKRIISEITSVSNAVEENRGSIIIVTVETGFSVMPADPYAAAYRDILGRVNQRIAHSTEEAYFSASGIQFKIR